jgi:hypothetical protein
VSIIPTPRMCQYVCSLSLSLSLLGMLELYNVEPKLLSSCWRKLDRWLVNVEEWEHRAIQKGQVALPVKPSLCQPWSSSMGKVVMCLICRVQQKAGEQWKMCSLLSPWYYNWINVLRVDLTVPCQENIHWADLTVGFLWCKTDYCSFLCCY